MLIKKQVLKVFKELPEEFSLHEAFEKLFFLDKINRGVRESGEGKFMSTVQVRKKLRKWLK